MSIRIGCTILPIDMKLVAPFAVEKILPKFPGAIGFGEITTLGVPAFKAPVFIITAEGGMNKSVDDLIGQLASVTTSLEFTEGAKKKAKGLLTRTLSEFLANTRAITDLSVEYDPFAV